MPLARDDVCSDEPNRLVAVDFSAVVQSFTVRSTLSTRSRNDAMAESTEDVAPAIDKANNIDDRPVVIDFRTDAFEKVFPMVAAGASNDDIIVDPSLTEGGGR